MLSIRLVLPIVLVSLLGGCAEKIWATDDAVSKSSYTHSGPTSITLVTVISNATGSGGHSSLVINAHERVVYDPAGNFESPQVPERNDLLFGMNPVYLRAYYGFHARKEWHVVTQEIEVSPEVADIAYKAASENGAAAPGFCANNVTRVLSKVPGFEDFGHSLSPLKAMKKFAALPDVKTDKIYEYD